MCEKGCKCDNCCFGSIDIPVGPKGDPGSNGTNGINGINGLNGQSVHHSSFLSSTGSPSNVPYQPGETDTYTLWGDAGETINLGTFGVYNGIDGTNGTNGTNGSNGTNGVNGMNGTNGLAGNDGIDGAPGSKIYFVEATPPNSFGDDTDVAIDNVTNSPILDVYQKESGVWQAKGQTGNVVNDSDSGFWILEGVTDQTGTNPPVITELRNTFPGAITPQYDTAGQFIVQFADVLSPATIVLIGTPIDADNKNTAYPDGGTAVKIQTKNSAGVFTNGLLQKTAIYVKAPIV